MTHTSTTSAGHLSSTEAFRFRPETFKETGPILVALKPSEGGDSALAMAQWLADKTASELQVLCVADMEDMMAVAAGSPLLPSEYYLRERTEATVRLRAQAAQGPHGDATCRVDVLEGPASITIAHTARDRGVSVLVVGTGRHAVLGRFLYGERALEVVRNAVGPVLVVPETGRPPFAHAMVAVDFSQASMRAAVAALGMLGRGGHLSLVHVKSAIRLGEDSVGWWNDAYELRSRELLASFADALPEPPEITVDTALLRGETVSALLQFAADQDVDLISCARRRHSLVERVLVGSVSSALVRRAPCSVLVAPERSYDTELEDASWMTGVHVSRNPNEWPDLLRGVTKRNAGRRAQLVMEAEHPEGVESIERGYAFLVAEYSRSDKRVNVMLGDAETPGSHLTHRLAGVRELEMIADSTGRDTKLQFDAASGRCILTFVDPR
jgi:nucleotide-binding universal stress UspA family protein